MKESVAHLIICAQLEQGHSKLLYDHSKDFKNINIKRIVISRFLQNMENYERYKMQLISIFP